MCDKGYHNVSCVDIAKYASVSTGIIYQYFKDKRDIFIAGTKEYVNNIIFPMLNIMETKISKKDLRNLVDKMIDSYIKMHTIKKEAHEELMAMSHLDEDIANIFKENEMLMTDKISNILLNSGIKINDIEEKFHIIIGIVDNYCHEVVYHKHKNLNYDIMKNEILDIIASIL